MWLHEIIPVVAVQVAVVEIPEEKPRPWWGKPRALEIAAGAQEEEGEEDSAGNGWQKWVELEMA